MVPPRFQQEMVDWFLTANETIPMFGDHMNNL
jgi:hypothetical protein